MLWNHQEEVRTSASSEDKKIRLLENFKRPGVTFKEALMMDKDRKLKKKEVSVHSLDEDKRNLSSQFGTNCRC
ncbi:hypothetical protein REPUB_Repub04eG0043600 [Reevesia pubescens]